MAIYKMSNIFTMKQFRILVLGVVALGLFGCGAGDSAQNSTDIAKQAGENTLAIETEIAKKSAIEYLAGNPEFTLFEMAIRSSKLKDELAEMKNITIFAPTNAAFGKVEDTRKFMATLQVAEEIKPMLKNHMLDIAYGFGAFTNENVKSLSGKNVKITGKEMPLVNGSPISKAIKTNDGYIYVISDFFGFESADDEKKNN